MRRHPHAANIDLNAITGGEGDAPETAVPDSLNGNTGDDSQDGEYDEGEEVSKHAHSDEEGNGGHRHCACAIRAAQLWHGYLNVL